MRIGIACYPTYGGSGIVATELAIALADRGHRVHVFSYDVPSRLTDYRENLRFHEVESYTYPLFRHPYYTLNLTSKMMEVVGGEGLDLLHVHYAIPHSVSAYLVRAMGNGAPKVITTLHGTDITLVGLSPSFHPITRFAIEQSDAVTAVSRHLAERTRAEFGIARAIDVIPNFVDTERFRPRVGARPEGPRVLLHVSNFRPVKRAADAVRVLARLREAGVGDLELWLVGEGPDLPMVRQEAVERGVVRSVRFLGRQESVESLMARADLFLLPSETESFGLAALEGMACGVPVVGTDAGGVPEVVAEGESGFLVPVGDVDAMAERCRRLLSDPALHRRMAEAARRTAVERFDLPRGVETYEILYRRVTGEVPVAPGR